jgi:hypothetical protein
MDLFKGTQAKLLLLLVIGIILAALHPDVARQILGQCRDWISKASPGSAPADDASQPSATPVSAAFTQAQSSVESCMRAHAVPQSTFTFLDWSDFQTSGQVSAVIVRYRVQQPSQPDVLASVRFTIQAGTVIKCGLDQPSSQPAGSPAPQPARIVPQWTPPPVVVDRFTTPIFESAHGPSMTLHLSDSTRPWCSFLSATRTSSAWCRLP